MTEQIEQYMRTLKLGGLAKEWRSVSYCDDPEQYVKELLLSGMFCTASPHPGRPIS